MEKFFAGDEAPSVAKHVYGKRRYDLLNYVDVALRIAQ